MQPSSKQPFVNVTIFSGFWALQLFVTKSAFINGATLAAFVFLSALATLLVCSVYLLPKNFRELQKLWHSGRKALLIILLAGFVHYGLGGMFSTAGVALTSATNAAFLSKLSFVFTIGMAALFLSEPLTQQKLSAAALMLLGSFLLATQGQGISTNIGNILVIIACICWSGGTILVKIALKYARISGELITAVRPFVGAPILLIYSLWLPQLSSPTRAIIGEMFWTPEILAYALMNGLLTVLTWVFLNRTLTVASASYMTMMSMMTPVLVAILGYSFLNENLTWIQLLGAVLIIVAAVTTHILESRMRLKAIPT